jgi:hypothetical protein
LIEQLATTFTKEEKNMFNDSRGPIEHFSWGKFIILGKEHSKSDEEKVGVGKDIRLIGRDVTKWRERKGHQLTPSMITGVYDKDIEVLIIGIGVYGAIECSEDVKRSVQKNGIKHLILERTPDACRRYNVLFHEGKRVALLAHGTC